MESNLDMSKFMRDVKKASQDGIGPYSNQIVYIQQLGRELNVKESIGKTDPKIENTLNKQNDLGKVAESDDREL